MFGWVFFFFFTRIDGCKVLSSEAEGGSDSKTACFSNINKLKSSKAANDVFTDLSASWFKELNFQLF